MPDMGYIEQGGGNFVEGARQHVAEALVALGTARQALQLAVAANQMVAEHANGDGDLAGVDFSAVGQELAELATGTVGLVQDLVSAGAVEAPDLALEIEPRTLELGSGEDAGNGYDDLAAAHAAEAAAEVAAANAAAKAAREAEAKAKAKTAKAGGSKEDMGKNPDGKPITKFIRCGQESILVKFFGEQYESDIEKLTQPQMEAFGELVGELYLGANADKRGVAEVPVRAEQFNDVISGMTDQDLQAKYGVKPTGVKGSLRYACREILPKSPKLAPETLGKVFEATLQQMQA